MINKLTLNGITIEYPSQMMVAINGTSIRLLPGEVNQITIEEQTDPVTVTEFVKDVQETPVKPRPAPNQPFRKVMPHAAKKVPRTVTKATKLAVETHLPSNWKVVVIKTLKDHDGSCYARMLSSRVFQGMGKITWARAESLRRALRAMVAKGELLALGTSSNHQSAQMLYGLPTVEDESRTAAHASS